MKSFASLLLATAVSSYQLAAFSEGSTISIGDNMSITWAVESECLIGLRAPAGWGEYMDFHEGANWMEQVYSNAYAEGSLNVMIGDISATITPKWEFWDLVFFMELFMYFPHHEDHEVAEEEEEEIPNWCNYQGWAQEWFTFFLDIAVTTYECDFETYSFIVDGVNPACGWTSYAVDEVLELGFLGDKHTAVSGQYEWGWNTCQDHPEFGAYSTEEWGFMEGHPFQEEQEEMEE
jgi:hypothetical protein